MRRLIPRWRKMTWVLWIESAIFLIWIIGASADRPSKECPPNDQLCIDASDAGTAIGVGLVFVFWFMVTVICFLIWFATRPRHDKETE